jgi:SAM-dependent methyltransferase
MAVAQWLGRNSRRVLRALPPPAQHRIRHVYRRVRPATAPAPPTPRQVALPEDVRDRQAVYDLLSDNEYHAEGVAYLHDHLERFRTTMAVIPPLPEGAAVLELGSSPYFITRLLVRRGYTVTTSNFSGAEAAPEYRLPAVVRSPRRGTIDTFAFDYFNVETDRFPYPDGSFDMVLCCELLEHLPEDPTHMLAEIHRVLRKGTGRLVLTTPNSARWEKLVAIQEGRNVYERISGYGTHGRHNREYLVWEVRELLSACGYRDLDVFALDVHDHQADRRLLPGIPTGDRECNIFAVATAVGEPRWAYPDWLYISRGEWRRLVRPDLRAGFNHDLQAFGFGAVRRRGDEQGLALEPARAAEVLLENTSEGPAGVRVEGWYEGEGPARLSCRVGDAPETAEVAGPAGGAFTILLPLEAPPGRFTAELRCETPGVVVAAVHAVPSAPSRA